MNRFLSQGEMAFLHVPQASPLLRITELTALRKHQMTLLLFLFGSRCPAYTCAHSCQAALNPFYSSQQNVTQRMEKMGKERREKLLLFLSYHWTLYVYLSLCLSASVSLRLLLPLPVFSAPVIYPLLPNIPPPTLILFQRFILIYLPVCYFASKCWPLCTRPHQFFRANSVFALINHITI